MPQQRRDRMSLPCGASCSRGSPGILLFSILLPERLDGKSLYCRARRGALRSFDSYVDRVVEVSASDEGFPKVERVVTAVDCGQPINPDIIAAQMEGGVGFGLSAALFNAIDLEDGRFVQSNFHDYRQLRIGEMPPVEVHIVPSAEPPTGVGEPGVPPIAPAVANAWAKLTGARVHELPFVRALSKA